MSNIKCQALVLPKSSLVVTLVVSLTQLVLIIACVAHTNNVFTAWILVVITLFNGIGILAAFSGHEKRIQECRPDIVLGASRIFDMIMEAVVITNTKAEIIAVNEAFTALTGWTEKEAVGKNPRILKSERHDAEFFKSMWNELLAEGNWTGDIWNRKRDGTVYFEKLSIRTIKNQYGIPAAYLGVFLGSACIDPKFGNELHPVNLDALTGLPNRNLFNDRLTLAMNQAERGKELIAVLYIDLSRFKYINTSYGYTFGDTLLQASAERICSLLRKGDTAARVSADDFIILAPRLKREEDAVNMAERIMNELRLPYIVQDKEVYVDASIGISFYPNDGTTPDHIIGAANAALNHAKENGAGSLRIYTPSLNERMIRRLSLDGRLRRAVEKEAFVMHYQPRINAQTRRVESMEVLVRWQDDDGTIIPPSDFIPLAEDTGLIVPIGEFVLAQSLANLKRWLCIDPSLRLSVNLSARQFRLPNLGSHIDAALSTAGIKHDRLELEITETLAMSDIVRSTALMTALNKQGITFSLDDFGTGYSSLYYLKRLPIQWLKIDQSFIRDIRQPDESPANAIVTTIIEMAKNLGLGTIAEGCETEEQYAFLARRGCEQIQGFLFSKPVPADEFEKLIGQTL